MGTRLARKRKAPESGETRTAEVLSLNINQGCLEDKFRKENTNGNSRKAETGPLNKKFNLTAAGAEHMRPSNPSLNNRTLIRCAGPASCKGKGTGKSQFSIRIQKQSNHGWTVPKLGYSSGTEKRRPEAKVRAVQAATRIKAEADRRLKIDNEREAARVALLQVQKTVELDNSELLRDLERLNCVWTWHRQRTDELEHNLTSELEKSGFLNPLEKLGLFIKDDDMNEEELEIQALYVKKGQIGAENDKCISKDATSHNLTLQKEEFAVIQEDLNRNRVPTTMSDKESAPNNVDGIPSVKSLSPSKVKARARRVAGLKNRFADIISKSQQTLVYQGKKADDPIICSHHKQEKKASDTIKRERLKKIEEKELQRLEAEEKKLKIEKERKAFRIALEQVKKTADLDNTEALEDLKRLNCSSYNRNNDELELRHLNPLERLGLFLKSEEMEDELMDIPARACDDLEEGEIVNISARNADSMEDDGEIIDISDRIDDDTEEGEIVDTSARSDDEMEEGEIVDISAIVDDEMEEEEIVNISARNANGMEEGEIIDISDRIDDDREEGEIVDISARADDEMEEGEITS